MIVFTISMIAFIIIAVFLWSALCVCFGMLLELEIEIREENKIREERENKNERTCQRKV